MRRALDSVSQDMRFAVRGVAKRPVLAAIVVVTLAIGIGGATSIFTILDWAVLRPLPYRQPHEIVSIWNTFPSWRGHESLGAVWDRVAISYPEYIDLSAAGPFDELAIYDAARTAVVDGDEPREIGLGIASETLLPLLGVELQLGRNFAAGEVGTQARPVAVLSDSYWRAIRGASPTIVGELIRLVGEDFEIVGVLPPGFRLRVLNPFGDAIDSIDVWIPVGLVGPRLDDRGHHGFELIGRLAAGATPESALDPTALLLAGDAGPAGRGARISRRQSEEVGGSSRSLALLFAAALLLMAVACGNVATLLLGAVDGRGAELATRAAFGAAPGRIVRQVFTESLLLGGVGSLLGSALAIGGTRLLVALAPVELHLPSDIGVDGRVLLSSVGLGAFTSLLFGTLPALLAGRRDLRLSLSRAGNTRSVAGSGGRAQRAVVALQVATSTILVVVAALLGRTLAAELSVNPGFSADNLTVIQLSLPQERYRSLGDASRFYEQAVARIAALPGVVAVSGSDAPPFSGIYKSSSFQIEGRTTPDGGKSPEALRRRVLPGFHETLGIPVLTGRGLTPADTDQAPPVTVVSESMAQRFWPDGSALGAFIERDERSWEIVGIVGDVLHDALSEEPRPAYYMSVHQEPENRLGLALIVETEGAFAGLAEGLRGAIREVDPELPIRELSSMPTMIERSTIGSRYRALLVAFFAGTATLLALLGIFGVTSRAVAARRRELGVRMALGAWRPRLIRDAVVGELPSLVAGVLAGALGALWASEFVDHFLFAVTRFDVLAHAATALAIGVAGLATCYVATRRAARMNPIDALRAEL